MLISFTVSNFRSIFEEQTLSLVSSRSTTGHEGHLRLLPKQKEKLLPTAIFYGANGAGKSNLIRALAHMQSLVVKGSSQKVGLPYHPFAFGEQGRKVPSTFEIRVLLENEILEYGFKTNAVFISEEWLVRIKGAKEEVIFERATKSGTATIEMKQKLAKSDVSQRVYFQSQAGTLPNQLFLSTVAANIPSKERGELFGKIIDWFVSQLNVIAPDAPFVGLPGLVRDNHQFASFAGNFLNHSSTGVSALKVVEEPLPAQLAEFLANPKMNSDFSNEALEVLNTGDSSSFIERKSDGSLVKNSILSEHGTDDDSSAVFPLSEESDGTQRLAHLLPALFVGSLKPKVFVIDEIDRSLHPLLAHKFIEYFLFSKLVTTSQLILTTHDTNLLDLDLFRRDEIWFAEKNKKRATKIYSLSDFKVRQDLRIDKGYLMGRFGAIPFLGELEKLFPKDSSPAKDPKAIKPIRKTASTVKV